MSTYDPFDPGQYHDRYSEMMDAIDAELNTFEWGVPARGETLGEMHVDRDTRRLHLRVWCLDNENDDPQEAQPLDVTQDILLDEDPQQQIRSLVHAYACHEIDEQLWFAGERPFYPHHQHPASTGR